jgi:hypothetical protein
MFVLEVCKALNESRIPYALVGGYAVALHGAVRGTVDIDLVIALDQGSFTAVDRVLKNLGLQPRLPVAAEQVYQFREEYIKNRNLIAWSFQDSQRPIKQVDIIITHDVKKMYVVSLLVNGIRIKVASIDSLIEMKMQSVRPQDLEDVKALNEIKKSSSKATKTKK